MGQIKKVDGGHVTKFARIHRPYGALGTANSLCALIGQFYTTCDRKVISNFLSVVNSALTTDDLCVDSTAQGNPQCSGSDPA